MNPDTQVSGFNGSEIKNPALGDGLNSLLSSGGTGFFNKFIPSAIGLLFVFGSISFFFMFLWGAISWILSGGDKAHVENAKGRITNAILGFILMIGVFAIVKLIEAFFGIDILLIDIGPLLIQ
jgi:hypothetical protein